MVDELNDYKVFVFPTNGIPINEGGELEERQQWRNTAHQPTLHKTTYDTESIVSSWRVLSAV